MKTILLIDDDYITRLHVTGILENSGYNVFSVSNTLSAVKVVSENKIDFIISDIVMPNFSYSGFIDWVKKEYNNSIPFMLISSLEYSEIEKSSFNLGTMYYMKKPILPDELLFYIQFEEKNNFK